MERGRLYAIDFEARKDIAWWIHFLPFFNGISIAWMHQHPQTDEIIATDACVQGIGGTCGKQFFYARIPKSLAEDLDFNITHYEMLALIVG